MRYQVKALASGVMQEFEAEAGNEQDLHEQLRQKGMQLVAARPLTRWQFSAGHKHFQLSLFTQELIALLEAGLTLIEAVETLKDKAGADSQGAVLNRIIENLYQGQPLSKVLGKMPEHFPPLYIATVGAAEKTGHLADALKRYHHYENRLQGVRKKIVSALVYPMVIITIGGGIMLFLLFYVIPKFSQIYASMRHLPFAAELMLRWGNLVHEHGSALFAGMIGSIALTIMLLRSPAMKTRLMDIFWRLPKVAQYQRLFALARFYRTVGLLLAGGLSVIAALELVAQLLLPGMKLALSQAITDIRAGQSLSATLPRYGLTTPVSERLLRVGEQSGELATMSERAAQFCDEELDRAIDMFTRLFEPILMLMIGIMIGTIVFLLYMPIFELAGNMQ